MITMTRGLSPFSPEYRIEVSVARKAVCQEGRFSIRSDQFHSCMELPFSNFLVSRLLSVLVVSEESGSVAAFAEGIAPNSGTSRYIVVSPGPWMVRSGRSCTTTKAMPKKAPARRPSAEFKTMLGL